MVRHRKRRPDLDERVSIDARDPEEALQKLLKLPPLDKRGDQTDQEVTTTPDP